MIRINLLEEKRKKRAKGPKNIVLALLAANLSALLIAAVATAWLKGGIARLKDQSDSNKAVVAKLTTRITEIKKLETLNKELEGKSKLIEMLRNNQSVPVRVLEEVNLLIPDGVWLTSLVFKDNGISLEGSAFSNIDIVSFIDNLKRSTVLSDTYLEESKESAVQSPQKTQRSGQPEEARTKIYLFKVNFRVKV